MLIDSHAHLNFQAFRNDVEEVLKRTLENNIWLINVGTKYETSKKAVEIAQRYSQGVFAAVGLHPIHLETGLVKIKNDKEEIEVKTKEEDFDYQKYKELAKDQKVVAIGEIGLDYYWRPKTTKKKELFKEKQKNLFLKQLELAKELNLPVIFHCRLAYDDLIALLKDRRNCLLTENGLRGVIHSFGGNWEQAEEYLKMGFYLGFNGLIFKMNLKEIIKKAPLNRILIETDCPYLTPPQVEGRNEPLYLKYIAREISQIKNLSFEKIAEVTTENAKKLFNLR